MKSRQSLEEHKEGIRREIEKAIGLNREKVAEIDKRYGIYASPKPWKEGERKE